MTFFDDAVFAGQSGAVKKLHVSFSSREARGFETLRHALKVFEGLKIKVTHVESRLSKENSYEFLIVCEGRFGASKNVLMSLGKVVDSPRLHKEEFSKAVPWFPRHISELDRCTHLLAKYEPDLDSEHPGFSDPVYRVRRQDIANIAFDYKQGQVIPDVEYTEEEKKTWTFVYRELKKLFATHACKEHIEAFRNLEKEGIYREDDIPQQEKISQFLKARSGFQLRPVAGLLSARDFLASLAYRVFQATQYVRHSSAPMHTPEPDCCHELLGHVPLLSDPKFAQFSQEIGMASLGASDDDITKLSTLYWFTIEFGLCRQNGEIRAFGAGLLSAFGELQYALSDIPEHRPFEPMSVAIQEYQDKTYQPIYFVSESFDDAKEKLRQFVSNMDRPYDVCYDPYTNSIKTLDRVNTVREVVQEMKGQLDAVMSALERLS